MQKQGSYWRLVGFSFSLMVLFFLIIAAVFAYMDSRADDIPFWQAFWLQLKQMLPALPEMILRAF